jgi:23S rRNA pseudouridine1911/1915/1917 synthase
LDYKVISSNKRYSLLKILLKTGRFHQIRAQLASMGCPVLGDAKYGADSSFFNKSICLAETSVTFKLATKEEYKTISINIPENWEKYLKN